MELKFFEDLTLRSTPLELKRQTIDTGTFSGFASIFGNVDAFGEIVIKGAFAKSIADWQALGLMPPLLFLHDPAEPIGKLTSMAENNVGLHITGELNRKTSRGKDAYEHIKAGDVSGLSIGFRISKDGRKSNGDGTYSLTKIDLMEVSVVTFPANNLSRINAVKHLDHRDMLERGLKGEIP